MLLLHRFFSTLGTFLLLYYALKYMCHVYAMSHIEPWWHQAVEYLKGENLFKFQFSYHFLEDNNLKLAKFFLVLCQSGLFLHSVQLVASKLPKKIPLWHGKKRTQNVPVYFLMRDKWLIQTSAFLRCLVSRLYPGTNFMALLTTKFCTYDHYSSLTVQVPNFFASLVTWSTHANM